MNTNAIRGLSLLLAMLLLAIILRRSKWRGAARSSDANTTIFVALLVAASMIAIFSKTADAIRASIETFGEWAGGGEQAIMEQSMGGSMAVMRETSNKESIPRTIEDNLHAARRTDLIILRVHPSEPEICMVLSVQVNSLDYSCYVGGPTTSAIDLESLAQRTSRILRKGQPEYPGLRDVFLHQTPD